MRTAEIQIDTGFDVRSDTPPGKDPDSASPTLRAYHKHLWGKPLPNGRVFHLSDGGRCYLHHRSELGEFFLGSDTVVPSFSRERRISEVIMQIPPEEIASFKRINHTIGGMMLFPANRVGRKMTINGARGFHPRIKDRFDLTMECIRRHYLGETNPLATSLARYADYFALFSSFQGFVDHFLLQDIVTTDYSAVKFFGHVDGFQKPLPRSVDEYRIYCRDAIDFIKARNRRIERFQQV